MRRWFKYGLLAALVLAATAELASRAAFDFPLYGADGEVGYWLLPNQSGTFLFRNDWAFESHGLGVEEEFKPSPKVDVLLVGDSIVYGGNGLQQDTKLGPVLEARSGWQVWPAAAGSWGLQNELAFLRRHKDLVAQVDAIVFVLNSPDFRETSEWRSRLTHPREYPTLYLPYLFSRYVLQPEPPEHSPFPVPKRDLLKDWYDFLDAANKPVLIVAYSIPEEKGQDCTWVPPAFRELGIWTCFDGLSEMGQAAFRDPVHPTTEAHVAIADRIIANLTPRVGSR